MPDLQTALIHTQTLLPTRPDLARQQAEAILQSVPAHPIALTLLATAHRLLGHPEHAATILAPLAQSQPRAPAVHLEWALTQADLGQPDAAIASLQHALHLNPNLAQAWRALADLHTLAGRQTEADAAYAQHIRAGVHDPALREAALALCDNDIPRTEHLLRAHLAQHPSDIAAIRMLAEAGIRLGRYEDAENLLAQCLELAPSFHAARANYALALFRQAKGEQALGQIEQLLARDPRDITLRNLLAACLALVGEHDRSIATYEAVLQAAPNQPKIWLSFGHILKTAGHAARAREAYRTSLRLAPTLGEAWWSLANMKSDPFSPADIAAIRTHLTDPAITADDRLHLHYALGFALEQTSLYQQSFEHYTQGAALRRTQIAYSADRTHAHMQRARALLTREFFAAREGWGHNDPAPIFIVGLPRSGSTLIEQILSSHPAIEGTMELPDIVAIARELGHHAERDTNILATLDATNAKTLGLRYIENTRIHRKRNRPHFIDKMPNNFVHTGLIALILPNAKIIDARRHPMAACFSAYKQHFARGQHFSYNLTDLARYYADYTALMAHFDQALPNRIHRVAYETMVENTEAETRRLLAYLGLDYDPACLRFHENPRAVRTASSEQVRRPIYKEGVEHWRNYEPWLSELERGLRKEAVLF